MNEEEPFVVAQRVERAQVRASVERAVLRDPASRWVEKRSLGVVIARQDHDVTAVRH